MGTSTREYLFKYRGWMGGLLIVPALAIWALSKPRVVEGSWFDEICDASGWLLLGCGMFLRLWATLYLGGRKGQTMVREGPYAACRHPLYIGSCFIILALACFLKSLTMLIAVVLAIILHGLLVIPSEERHLRCIFGEAYTEYQRSTPRFLPRLRLLRRPGVQEVKVAAFLRESARNLGLMVIALATEFVAHAKTEGWWPQWFLFP